VSARAEALGSLCLCTVVALVTAYLWARVSPAETPAVLAGGVVIGGLAGILYGMPGPEPVSQRQPLRWRPVVMSIVIAIAVLVLLPTLKNSTAAGEAMAWMSRLPSFMRAVFPAGVAFGVAGAATSGWALSRL
jgi:hypothetical protein